MAPLETGELYKGKGNAKFIWDSDNLSQLYAVAEHLTRRFGDQLLHEAKIDNVGSDQELIVLDEACGTGAVAAGLMDTLSEEAKGKLDLTMVDLAPRMVDLVNQRIKVNEWQNVKVVLADAADSKLPSSHFTHIFLNFGPFIFADPQAGLAEI
ncbi:uncharacterized protein A1O9_08908 [Exophiala aquamarina CBS 119918]|uniref:Methyltransferase domain-containing protein n=1 Tax=Exophiala aquamarina CBS 119918 TaxID=1182545 RepID=A0A072P581_9EURO|nr:uncharacterized protein A1O9_08908 [Exophiala aquamarina CBS 119918]KEF55254.1 hypothetical protein A1O9_08908 [Exophiala aquamarina CBS 119918]